jgi:hypothetical protein
MDRPVSPTSHADRSIHRRAGLKIDRQLDIADSAIN